MAALHGFLNINKPTGVTSAEVVNRVKQVCRSVTRHNYVKIGHCGTLDPLANGVLVLCLGHASRLQDILHEQPKSYVGRFLLGQETNTEDTTGEVTLETPIGDHVTREAITALLPEFTGRIAQVPPAFSSISIDGRRAYKMARKGRDVEIDAREVEIFELALTNFEPPYFDLKITCAAGTYIRSLGRDIGRRLGCGATMAGLTRDAVGPFQLDNAMHIDRLQNDNLRTALHPPAHAVPNFPLWKVTGRYEALARMGNPVPIAHAEQLPNSGVAESRIGFIGECGNLLAIGEVRPDRQDLKPRIVLSDKIGSGK